MATRTNNSDTASKSRTPRPLTLAIKQARYEVLVAHQAEVDARVVELMAEAGYTQETVTRWAK